MQSNPHKLTVIDGETLMDKRLPPTKFCVDTLLPQGLCILGGSPKVGKSWLVLDLCVHVAQGTPLWGLDTTKGQVLYLCLEDGERRIQERLNTITDNVPDGMYFATGCTSIESGVCDWLRDFKRQHPAISLIAIDTFQLIRTPTPDVSYGGDYAELRVLKELADELGICLLLVHHLRKMNDKDPVNKLSGSTGISGAVDAIFVLDKNERIERQATFYASGRDIRDRKIQLELDEYTCTWNLFDELMKLNETQPTPPPEPTPMVQMTLEDWERLSVMIRRLENLIDGQALTEELMTETAEKYLSAMKKTAEETNSSVKKTLEKMDRMYTQQVGKTNEMLSERIERRAIRDDVLWWVRFLAFSLPTLLVLALSVCYGWLPLG